MDRVHEPVPPVGGPVPTRHPRVAGPASAVLALQSAAGNAAVQRWVAQRFLDDDPKFKPGTAPDFDTFRRDLDETHEPSQGGTYEKGSGNAAQAIVKWIKRGKVQEDSSGLIMSGNPIALHDGRRMYPPLKKKSTDRPDNRSSCAERRAVEWVRLKLGVLLPEQRPVVYLYTEHLPCSHCRRDIVQLSRGHTWVDLLVQWKQVFEQDRAGAENWLAVRRNAAGWHTVTFEHTLEPPPEPVVRPRRDKVEKKGEAEGRAKREPLPARVAVGEPEQAVALVDRVVKHRAGRDGTKDERKRRRAEDDAALVVRQGDRQLVSTTRLAALLVLLSAAAVVGVLLRALGLW